MAPGFMSLLWFLVIIVMIPVALWMLKHTRLGGTGGLGAAGHNGLRSVATLAISPSQRIVTIEVGQGEQRQWLVLGVSPQNITTLHTMAPQGDAPAATEPLQSFAQLMGKFKRTPGAPVEP